MFPWSPSYPLLGITPGRSGCECKQQVEFGLHYLWAYFTPFKASVDDRTVLYRGIDRDDGVEYWIEFEATNMHVHGLVVPK
jgi:hypothetical protein